MVRSAFVVVGALVSSVAFGQKCKEQSCDLANISQTTNTPFDYAAKKRPSGGNRAGDMCIEKAWDKLGLPHPPGYGKGPPNYAKGGKSRRLKAREELMVRRTMVDFGYLIDTPRVSQQQRASEVSETVSATAATCKPNTLLFSRGTFEPYTFTDGFGSTVGPALRSALTPSSEWSFQGVNYDSDMNGNYCLGMTGGMKCVEHINKISKDCPKTKIVVSGYSQGAMVSHFCVAFASEAARKQVSSVVVFGDPFNGAPIKGFPSEKVKTYCNLADGVCGGKFEIGLSHLAYTTTAEIAEAVKFIKTNLK